jgi:fatty acid desaturase
MRNWYDIQSIAYIVLYVGFIIAQWQTGFSWLMYAGCLFCSIGVQVVHHNHIHLGIWHSKRLNNITNLLISISTAVPSAMVYGGHLRNHHIHQHGPEDETRTYRFGGDHNHLLGYLLHPIQAYCVLIPKFFREFKIEWPKRTRFSKDLLLQVCLIGALWIALFILDWRNFILLVAIPQAFGLHWLLGSNYFQHAHCDDESEVNYARNFTGAINLIWMNIGFHTAHHDHPRAHWSTLRKLHHEQCQATDPRLCCESFLGYVVRTFFLSSFFPFYRSESLKGRDVPSDI